MAGHQVGAGQGRQVPHLHAARRRQVVGRPGAHRRRRRLHLRAPEEGARWLRLPRQGHRGRRPHGEVLLQQGVLDRLLRDQRPLHPAEAHLVQGEGPGEVHQPEPGRHRPVHQDREVPEPVVRAAQEPRLLAAGQAADRRHPDARLLRQRQRQHRLHQRRGGLDAVVHPGHREVLRRQGQEAQPLLVPGHRRHDQLAAEHHQGAVQRPGRAQGAQHDRRPRPDHQGRDERLRRTRRLHGPGPHLRQVA